MLRGPPGCWGNHGSNQKHKGRLQSLNAHDAKRIREENTKTRFLRPVRILQQIPLQAASAEHMVQEAMKKMSVFFETDLSMESNDPIK